MKTTRLLLTAALAGALIAPAAGFASSADPGPLDKLSHGVADMTTGVLALPGSIKQETDANGMSGLPKGLGLGLMRTVGRELVGVYEFVTFPIGAPNDYGPIMQPSYPWDYFSNVNKPQVSSTR